VKPEEAGARLWSGIAAVKKWKKSTSDASGFTPCTRALHASYTDPPRASASARSPAINSDTYHSRLLAEVALDSEISQ